MLRKGCLSFIVSSNISTIKLHTNPKTSCERHCAVNGLDKTKAKQIYEPGNPKRNNSKYGESNYLQYNN